jgi:hypothetical protein
LYISDAKMPSGQEGFERQLNCSSGHLSDMHLEVSCKVPPNLATGTYRLGQVSISTGGDAPVIVRYTEGPEFSIRVENPGRIETPILRGIKDVLRH